MKTKTAISIVILLFISACGNIDKYPEAQYGSYEGYKEKITHIIKESAKNPDSIVIKGFSDPKKTLVQNTALSALWNPYFPAYGVCVRYKGTNSYGGYIEVKDNFYIKDGEVYFDSIAASNKGNGYDATTLKRYKPCNNW